MTDERPSKNFEFNGKHISIDWKLLVGIILALIGGGGSYAGFSLITDAEARAMLSETEKKMSEKHDALEKNVEENTEAIQGLTATIVSVQTVQHRDIAFREANRVVESIKCNINDTRCLERKNDERERIRQINMRRLGNVENGNPKPLETCFNRNCTN